jgi:phenylpropionate dioxygenase-like ring-hydroxylating dioxygenase large terminal subunit
MTTVTPIDENSCELNHTSYWTIAGLKWILKPIINAIADEFLGQDLRIAQRQQIGLKFKPKLTMIVKDSGLPGSWYFQGKREWNNATEEGRPFVNPIKEKVLRWMT